MDPVHSLGWIHLEGPETARLPQVAAQLGIHTLSADSFLRDVARSKLTHLGPVLVVTTHAVRMDGNRLEAMPAALFITPDAVVTAVHDDWGVGSAIRDRLGGLDELPPESPWVVAYAFLDYLVDQYLEVAEDLDEQAEDLEGVLFDEQDHHGLQRSAYALHKDLTQLRRIVMPMREVLSSLMRREGHEIPGGFTPYLQDVYDHVVLAGEWSDSSRDLVSNALSTQVAIQDNNLNVTMKKVTSWAAIIAVPAAVTGYFGMNVPYPGFNQEWGFWISVTVMVVSCLVLWGVFKKKDWL